jgi:transcriptional regulator with XRE-family HTH domain
VRSIARVDGMTLAPADASSFADLLRWFRVRAGLSQEMLAERAGVSLATIAALEQGHRRRPYAHTLLVISQALDLDATDSAMQRAR